jgi:bifunctional non-homologous end joining protein LigD
MTSIIKSIELHSTHAGSDKVYNVQLCEVDGGFIVNYQNGRRGGTLASGTKTKSPVAKDKAQTIYDRLVREKINGESHYVIVGCNASSATTAVTEKTSSGFLPMLPSAVDEADAEEFLEGDGWWMQPKLDGERVLVIVQADGQITGSNRLGFVRPLPAALLEGLSAAALPADSVFDGELVSETFHTFDLLRFEGEDCKGWGFDQRQQALESTAWGSCLNNVVRYVDTFKGVEKRERFAQLRENGAEGVIFREVGGSYIVGRADTCLKFKFTESATLLVDGHETDKHSVYLGGFDGSGQRITMGKVSIPPNFAIPDVNGIVEVQYLYAYPGTHALAQPVFKGVRHDQFAEACVLSQLKYKSDADTFKE